MAVRRGPNHAITTPIFTPLSQTIAQIPIMSGNLLDTILLTISGVFQNSLTSFASGPTAATGTYGAYGTGGGQAYFYKLIDLVSGLF